MKRIIEFRGKRLDNHEWVYGHYTQGTENNHYITNPDGAVWEVYPETICQYSGIVDVNSNEVYEDDIVKTQYGKLTVKHGGYWRVIQGQAIDGNGFGWFATDETEQNVIQLGPLTVDTSIKVIDNLHQIP